MPTYIHLTNYTSEGVENIAASPDRLEDAKELAASLEGEFKQFFLTFGEYDIVAITEFPDDEAAAQFALGVASGGSVTTETLKAFTEDEYREVIDGIPSVAQRANPNRPPLGRRFRSRRRPGGQRTSLGHRLFPRN
jgi:uncharacterized protein with GYD domain